MLVSPTTFHSRALPNDSAMATCHRSGCLQMPARFKHVRSHGPPAVQRHQGHPTMVPAPAVARPRNCRFQFERQAILQPAASHKLRVSLPCPETEAPPRTWNAPVKQGVSHWAVLETEIPARVRSECPAGACHAGAGEQRPRSKLHSLHARSSEAENCADDDSARPPPISKEAPVDS